MGFHRWELRSESQNVVEHVCSCGRVRRKKGKFAKYFEPDADGVLRWVSDKAGECSSFPGPAEASDRGALAPPGPLGEGGDRGELLRRIGELYAFSDALFECVCVLFKHLGIAEDPASYLHFPSGEKGEGKNRRGKVKTRRR